MLNRKRIALAIMLAFAGPALAQDAELEEIRADIKNMKQVYERRIQALEARLAAAESKTGAAGTSAANTVVTAAASERSRGENAHNPAISLVLQGTYASTKQSPDSYRITGFMPSGGEAGPPKRSFGLGESESVISANIDTHFRGVAIASVAPDGGAAMEEAYFQTLALPAGFTLKGGRYFSGLGYLNERHQHTWDFQDAPLPYKAFLGGRLRQDGLQMKWIAPTNLLVELGAEISSGDQFPGSDRNKNGTGASSIFGHIGGDIGASYAWRTGLSYLMTSPRDRTYADTDALGGAVENSFSGNANLWVADAVLKWAPHGNATRTSFNLQGEYFRLNQNGRLSYDDSAGSAVHGALSDVYASRQSGWYLQGVYQFMPQWRVGYRHDRLSFGTLSNALVQNGAGPSAADFPLLTPYSPQRNTLMLDWNPTEFSRIRLQYAADQSRSAATDRQVLVQYIYSLGAHGAHRF